MTRRVLVALLAAGVVAPLVCSGPPASAATTPAKPYDFDGDGRQELVAAAPGLYVGDMGWDAGGVVVLPTSSTGVSLEPRLLTQDLPELGNYSVEGGRFGYGLASADFDRDGYAELVISTAVYIGYGTSIGALTVIPGSPRGLDLARLTSLGNPDRGQDDNQNGVYGNPVVGDFTGDGFPDLAVGAGGDSETIPGESHGASGEALVFSGGSRGLTQASVRTLERQGPGGGHQDWDSGFGSTLGAGDLNGDGIADLVVGSSGSDGTYGGVYPGSVSVCPGVAGGPTGCTRLAHSLDYVGATSFAVGRVTGGARPDLVVALPHSQPDAVGSVRILRLKPTGPLAVEKTLVLTQASRGVPGVDEPNDAFGSALALTDLDRDGYADLVIGAPGENRGKGSVTIVHGASGGWRTKGNSTVDQDTKGVPGKSEPGDAFGSSLTLLDHDGDGRLDLSVGAPGENGSGAVTTLPGKGEGFTTKGSLGFGLKTLGISPPANADLGDPLGS